MSARGPRSALHEVLKERPTLRRERHLWAGGYCQVAGLDEAGRGAWAGPVVAGVVVLPPNREDVATLLAGVDDSKRLTPAEREALLPLIEAVALAVGTGQATPAEIDACGIVAATRLAMERALASLHCSPDYLLIDHLTLPRLSIPQEAIVRGDARVLSIAAASVVAKVTRDRMMVALDDRYPGYGFARHKGYGTAAHQEALHQLGPSPIHRRTWAPVRAATGTAACR